MRPVAQMQAYEKMHQNTRPMTHLCL